MTKARDLANIISGGFTADDIPNLDASKITSGSLADARIPNLTTAKITSGTFADARISQSSVVAHSPQTDLQPVKSDITALALREATNESSASFNLPNQHIDTFATDTLATKTNTVVLNGNCSSGTLSSTTGNDSNTQFLFQPNESNGSTTFTDSASNSSAITRHGGVTHTTAQSKFGTSSVFFDASSNGQGLEIAYDSSLGHSVGQAFTLDMWVYSTNWGGANQGDMKIWDGASNHRFGFKSNGSTMGGEAFVSGGGWTTHNMSNNAWHHIAWVSNTSNLRRMYVDGVQILSGTHNDNMNGGQTIMMGDARGLTGSEKCENLYLGGVRRSNVDRTTDSNDMMYISSGTSFSVPTNYYGTTVSNVSATGTAIQNTNTVGSAKTKVGGTILYKDLHGSATLGTDLKIYFTCNGGTNWTEASSYSAITPVYSTGIKQVRLGETTCTSGTDVRYKAVWANQSANSKQTELHGIGINY